MLCSGNIISYWKIWPMLWNSQYYKWFQVSSMTCEHCKKTGLWFWGFFLAVLGLSCGTWDLSWGMQDLSLWCVICSLQCKGFSLVVACRFSFSSCEVFEFLFKVLIWYVEINNTDNVTFLKTKEDFPGGAVVKNPPANAEDMGPSPGRGRSHMPQSN